MPTIRCHTTIDVARETLFALTQDYTARPKWDPFHRDYRLLDGESKAPGARVWYRASNGLTMTVKYVTHDPPERVAIAMISGPWMFSVFAGTWIFKSLGPTTTDVGFHYAFQLRVVPRLFEGFVARRLERMINARLRGLKRFAEATSAMKVG